MKNRGASPSSVFMPIRKDAPFWVAIALQMLLGLQALSPQPSWSGKNLSVAALGKVTDRQKREMSVRGWLQGLEKDGRKNREKRKGEGGREVMR